ALAVRLASDPPARERAQVALARLRDPGGYDLWWLVQPGSLESRRWHILFPVITASTVMTLALAAMWPILLLVVPLATVVNLLLRIATASRVGGIVGSFRQVAPLV